jgi:hypothetical protein
VPATLPREKGNDPPARGPRGRGAKRVRGLRVRSVSDVGAGHPRADDLFGGPVVVALDDPLGGTEVAGGVDWDVLALEVRGGDGDLDGLVVTAEVLVATPRREAAAERVLARRALPAGGLEVCAPVAGPGGGVAGTGDQVRDAVLAVGPVGAVLAVCTGGASRAGMASGSPIGRDLALKGWAAGRGGPPKTSRSTPHTDRQHRSAASPCRCHAPGPASPSRLRASTVLIGTRWARRAISTARSTSWALLST